ncbi:MAG: AAA family ATPase, partial [Alphaproteobacteria bacterium]|nr:AAA family ATPase [Alphaproteobacteria bacterium]
MMLNSQTIEKLKDMKLNAMAKALAEQLKNPEIGSISFDDRFGMLVDEQWSSRRTNRIVNLIQKAKFKFPDACIENIDYAPDRKLDRELIASIADGRYIREKNNVIIMGAAGTGKSFMGCAFGIMACRQLKRVRYIRLPELLEDMNIARCTGNDGFRRLVVEYKKYDVLILDEWLHRPL